METPIVEYAADNLIKKRWGQSYFFKKDGRKWRFVPRKLKLPVVIGTIVLFAFMILQALMTDPTPSNTVAGSLSGLVPDGFSNLSNAMTIPKAGPHTSSESPGKQKHLSTIKYSGAQVINRPSSGPVPPGLTARAILISGASNGILKAQLLENLELNGETFLETGTLLVGHGSSSEDRLYVNFEKALRKDGSIQSFHAQACDLGDRIAGLKGSTLKNNFWKLVGSVGLGFVGGLSRGLEDSKVENGVIMPDASLKNGLLNGTATAAIEQSREYLNSKRDQTQIIEVKDSTHFLILTEEN